MQHEVKKLLKQFGCEVLDFSQPFRALQTRGIADLLVIHVERNRFAWMEVKAAGGKQSRHQLWFQVLVEAVGMRYVIGGIAEAVSLLREWGFKLGATPGEEE